MDRISYFVLIDVNGISYKPHELKITSGGLLFVWD